MIFKQAQEELYPDPEIGLDPEFVKRIQDRTLNYTTDYVGFPKGHYIIRGNGTADYLTYSHETTLNHVLNPEKKTQDYQKLPTGTANRVHHLYGGGIKVFIAYSAIYIESNQLPNKAQSETLRQMTQAHNLPIEYEGKIFPNGERKYIKFDTTDFNKLINYWNSHRTQSGNAQERLEKLQEFRSPFYGKVPTIEIPEKSRGLSQEDIRTIQKMPVKPRIERSAALLKIAHNLDKQGKYQASDCVVKLAQKGKQQPSLFFDQWSEGHDIKDKQGNTQRLYHGTFSPFNEFKPSRDNDNYYGGDVIYTTTNPLDAQNYTTLEGGDWKNKMENLADKLDADNPEITQYGLDENSTWEERIEAAKKILNLDKPRTIPLYGKMKNPARVTLENPTWYSSDYDEDTEDLSGLATEIYQHIIDLAYEYGMYEQDINHCISQVYSKLEPEGFSAEQLDGAIRNSDFAVYLEDDNGNLVYRQFIAELFKRLGHDGIILDSHNFLGHMPHSRKGDYHMMFFDPQNLKSAIGNTGIYDPSTNNLTQ